MIAALHVVWLVLEGVGPVDDDYIVYRYARQWLGTGTLAFNDTGPGSAAWSSEGFTSPLWLLLCTLAEALGVRPGLWTPAVGAFSSALTAAFVGLAARRACRRAVAGAPAQASETWGLAAAALMTVSPSLSWHAVSGLGTVPMAAAVAVGLWAASARRPAAFGAAMVIAVWFRMEALLVALPVGLLVAQGGSCDIASARAKRYLTWLAPVALSAAVLMLLRWQLFHRWLPATYFAKRLPLAEELGYGARYLVRSTLEGGLPLLGLIAIAGMGDRRLTLFVRGLGVVSLLALSYVVSCGGDWMVYGRFLVPFAPAFVLGATGVVAGAHHRAVRFAGATAMLVLVLAGLRPEVRSQAIFEHRFFEAWWLRVGDELRARAPEDASVAVSPIGAIGWRSKLSIIDILGLTHDAFLDLAPDLEGVEVKGHHRHSGAWVLDQEPTYLLLGNAVVQPGAGSLDVNPWERDIVADPRFRRDYVRESAWVDEPDGSRRPLPYFRRSSAPPLTRASK
ncbi:hypothetical protein [Planctomycetes bacterium Poly30]|uniref:hypothetical protein n=1 Tax=Saltatorellus ferox TaxID=2528018 RepID=UPI0011A66EF9